MFEHAGRFSPRRQTCRPCRYKSSARITGGLSPACTEVACSNSLCIDLSRFPHDDALNNHCNSSMYQQPSIPVQPPTTAPSRILAKQHVLEGVLVYEHSLLQACYLIGAASRTLDSMSRIDQSTGGKAPVTERLKTTRVRLLLLGVALTADGCCSGDRWQLNLARRRHRPRRARPFS